MPQLQASLIIPTFRRDEWVKQCLQRALNQIVPPLEIIVIDQTLVRSEETKRVFDELSQNPKIKWIRQELASVTRARNLAANIAKADILIFVDDDVYFEKDFIEQHLSFYQSSDVVSVAGQVSVFPDNHPCRKKPEIKWKDDETFNSLPYNDRQRVFKIQGCNWSVKRDVYISLGGVDEAFEGPSWGEEDDFACRMGEDHTILFSERARVVHFRAAVGGCRIEPTQNHTDLQKWTCVFTFMFRHGFWLGKRDEAGRPVPQPWIQRWYQALRHTLLIKKNVLRPWKCLLGVSTLFEAISQSKKLANRPVRFTTVEP